jgi:hypothetical protein
MIAGVKRGALGLVLLMFSHPTCAADAAASFLVKLFMSACSPNVGRSDKVRDWRPGGPFQASLQSARFSAGQ